MTDFGEILRNIGEFGLFQKITLIALCFPNFVQTFLYASFVFIQSDPDRHCNTDWILSAAPNMTSEEQLNLTVPREEDGTFSKCEMFVPVSWDIDTIREYGLNETTGCQDGWVYGNMLYEATIVTDFDLVCGQASLVEVIQAVFMAGVLVGSLMFGPFAESFLITATEWIGTSKRSWGTCVTQLFNAIGECVLAGMIYGIRNWRLAQLITAVPLAVLIIYIWFIPESARWLLSRGRKEEAKQLIVKAAAINKHPVSESLLDKVVNHIQQGRSFQEHRMTPVKYLKISVLYSEMGSYAIAVTSLAVSSRFFLIWAGSICMVFMQELFPTSVRQTATSLGSISARLGGLLAPLLNLLAMYHSVIPITVFSCLTLIGGFLGFLLPETKRKELPETTEEAERNGHVSPTRRTTTSLHSYSTKM
ncbi:solute carrier family 22 member 13-like [Simochromis diagramma]|uniref:solute carrier family 22 member 13-like n=1 Tax=Simochromis diagramma TaxID=43689 RepID=UPI001A7E8314|nr:solute carrier family 22 member 13-like [Simochromis diagramma]